MEEDMKNVAPAITRTYQSHHLDSTRWQRFRPRPDDIVVATPYKSGTTWMQTVVLHLIFGDLVLRDLDQFSPWIDLRWWPLDPILDRIEAQKHRRVVKSHLPLDGLHFFPEAKYIFVGRDPRDVFMSLWNHYSNYTEETYKLSNNPEGLVGAPMPPAPAEIRDFWQSWISRGSFAWESQGYPFWSNLRQTQTWWDYRHLPNILFVHYNDLLADLEVEIARVAVFLEIDLPPETLQRIAELVGFDNMKRDADKLVPGRGTRFQGGAKIFIFKGTNGRWRDVLTEDDLALYPAAVARDLTPECAAWLEKGAALASEAETA
jgi:aryl sulfotransferase